MGWLPPSQVVVATGKILQGAGFEDLDLLLSIRQLRLAQLEEFGAALVRGQRLLERKLPVFHARNDAFELAERTFERGS